jgi:hypothetical protein
MTKGKDYQAAADWAEHDMTLKLSSTTPLRGEAAVRMAEPHWCGPWAAGPRSTQTQSLGSTPPRGRSAYQKTSTPNSTKSPPHRTRPSEIMRAALTEYRKHAEAGQPHPARLATWIGGAW